MHVHGHLSKLPGNRHPSCCEVTLDRTDSQAHLSTGRAQCVFFPDSMNAPCQVHVAHCMCMLGTSTRWQPLCPLCCLSPCSGTFSGACCDLLIHVLVVVYVFHAAGFCFCSLFHFLYWTVHLALVHHETPCIPCNVRAMTFTWNEHCGGARLWLWMLIRTESLRSPATRMFIQGCMHMFMYMFMHMRMHMHTHTCTCRCTRTRTCTHICAHTSTCTYTHKHMDMQTHTHTHAHTTHMRTQLRGRMQ